jgi:dienelactone hydrolase
MRAALIAVALAVSAGTAATAHAGKALVERTPFAVPAYDKLSDRDRYFLPQDVHAAVTADTGVTVERIRYKSGKLTVAGFLVKPTRATAKARLPVVIWCRGGYGPESVVGEGNVETIADMVTVAGAGFVVLMPNYRGNDGGEGVDERGGAEVEDVKALVPVAREIEGADASRVFIYGVSRGALDALIAVREGLPARAVVVTGPVVNELERPLPAELLRASPAGVDWTTQAAKERRSPIRWAKEITAPILILQGGSDRATPPDGALDFARTLEKSGAVYELWVVAGGDHGLTRQHRNDKLARTIDWFQRPRTKPLSLVLERALDEGGIPLAKKRFAEARKAGPGVIDMGERDVNTLGYILLNQGRNDHAIVVFELNTQAHPKSANVWDSLGEAHATAGHKPQAIKAYRKALALDPKSASAKAALDRLTAKP